MVGACKSIGCANIREKRQHLPMPAPTFLISSLTQLIDLFDTPIGNARAAQRQGIAQLERERVLKQLPG
jgi:hypothetical protein